MGRKLNLKAVNHSLKEGFQPTVQEVTEDNMYDIMKQNHEFQKEHREEIRDMQKQQEQEKASAMRMEVEQYKQQRIADRENFKNAPLKAEGERAPTVNDGLSVE